jgi:NADH dehydrogenase [ubiquinone] 1 alpha subcomplex assembly factor 5
LDASEEMLARDLTRHIDGSLEIYGVQADEEHLPIQPKSVDLALSCLSLHWVNDLPGVLKQIRRSLKPDSVFIGALLGGSTLQELRSAFALAEDERYGGLSPHISPLTTVRDVGSLLQRAGFNLLTVDVDTITIPYPDMFTLMNHLKYMGEGHAIWERRHGVPRETFLAAAAAYEAMFADENLDGLLPATFQVIYMIGWSPDPSQLGAAERGSATVSLKDLEK